MRQKKLGFDLLEDSTIPIEPGMDFKQYEIKVGIESSWKPTNERMVSKSSIKLYFYVSL